MRPVVRKITTATRAGFFNTASGQIDDYHDTGLDDIMQPVVR